MVVWCSPEGSDDLGDGSQANPFRQPYQALKYAESITGAGADGTRVFLREGSYLWGGTSNWPPVTHARWAVIEAAPGSDPDNVVFDSNTSAGFKTKLIAVRGVAFESFTVTTAMGDPRAVWFDDCRFRGPGRTVNSRAYQPSNWQGGLYVTDSSLEAFRDGFIGAGLVRSCTVDDIGSDAFTQSKMVLNSAVINIDPTGATFHADVYQLEASTVDNVILYGLKATESYAQRIFFSDSTLVENVAVVNTLVAIPWGRDLTDPPYSQLSTPLHHLVILNVSMPNSTLLFRSQDMENIRIEQSLFGRVGTAGGFIENDWFDWCHFVDDSSQAIDSPNASSGDPRMIDPAGGNFGLLDDSPLRNRVPSNTLPADIEGERRSSPDSVGAFR